VAANVPFRSLAGEFAKVAQAKGPAPWRRLGDVIDRNFAEIDKRTTGRTATVTTTNATVTTIASVPIPVNRSVVVDITVVGRRTGGSAGTTGDSAGYRRVGTYKNIAGTVTIVGALASPLTAEDQAGWNCTIATATASVDITVAGAANNDVTWTATIVVTMAPLV
jgi:hypothetical protein